MFEVLEDLMVRSENHLPGILSLLVPVLNYLVVFRFSGHLLANKKLPYQSSQLTQCESGWLPLDRVMFLCILNKSFSAGLTHGGGRRGADVYYP